MGIEMEIWFLETQELNFKVDLAILLIQNLKTIRLTWNLYGDVSYWNEQAVSRGHYIGIQLCPN